MAGLTFADLSVGDRFVFAFEYFHDFEWFYLMKTGDRTFERPNERSVSGIHEDLSGRVGVGDQPVIRRAVAL